MKSSVGGKFFGGIGCVPRTLAIQRFIFFYRRFGRVLSAFLGVLSMFLRFLPAFRGFLSMFLFFERFVDELIRRLESIRADGSFITSHKLFHRFKDFYHRPAKFIHPSSKDKPKNLIAGFSPGRKAKGPLYLRKIRFTCRKRNLLAESSALLVLNEIYLQQSSLYLQNPLFTCRIQYFTCSKPVLFAKSRSLFTHIKTRPLS